MAGTRAGGLKAAAQNKAKNPNFYRDIGKVGGTNGNTGGFAADVDCNCDEIKGWHFKRQCAGTKGGRISRRPKKA